MSDFFTRLTERALGLALIIQPFKPSLFAPELDAGTDMPFVEVEGGWSGVGGLVPPRDRGLVGADLSRPSPIDRPETETPLLNPAFAQTPAPAHKPETSTTVGSGVDLSAVGKLAPGPDKGVTSNKLSVKATLSQANLHRSLEQNRRGAPTAESFSPHSPTTQEFPPLTGAIEFAAQHGVISQTHNALSHESLPSQGVESGRSSNISANNKESAAIPPAEMSVGARAAGSGRVGLYGRPWKEGGPLLRTSTPPSRAQLEASRPESTIQVTIGRVEVRAVTTPATSTRSQQQPTRPPAMSLDEYLRRQEQGGRR